MVFPILAELRDGIVLHSNGDILTNLWFYHLFYLVSILKSILKKQQQQFIGTLSILLLLSFYASNVDQKRKFNTKQQHPKLTSPLSSVVFTIIFYSSPNMKFLRQKHWWNKCESESLIPKSAISYSINACTISINSHLYMYV